LVTKPHNKTPYELLHGRTPSIGFMRPFGCPVTILNTLDSLGKFDRKVDEGFLVEYSASSKAFRVFNSRTRIVQETLHVNFLENKPNVTGSGPTWLFDIDSLTKTMNYQPVTAGNQSNPSAGFQDNFDAEKAGEEIDQRYESKFDEKKPESKVNVSPSSSAQDLSVEFEDYSDNCINEVNAAELKDITFFNDEDDVGAEADFNNLETSITISLILKTRVHKDHHVTQIIGDLSLATQTKSMTRVAKDQDGLSQMFNDDFHTLARIEAIRLFLAYASFMGFMVYRMDVKSAFLYGTIKEEVYVCQPSGFEDLIILTRHTKWSRHFMVYIKLLELGDILLVRIYVDDIIFGATNKDLCKSFEKLMKDKFQMSSTGELTFFLGLQVKQKKNGIFISQDKYVAEILRKFRLQEGKSASTPIDTEKLFLKDPDGEDVDIHTYRSMIGSLMYFTSSRPDIMFAVVLSGIESLKRILHVTNNLSACSLTIQQMVLNSPCLTHIKNWLVQIKRALGQTATGKEISNPFMVGRLKKIGIEVSAVDLQTTVVVKKANDVIRLQALVDKKKVVVTEATIREALCLDDAEGVECPPNEEIFAELARMGYEKPSTKLTFYKAFFSSQWKFLIHTILQCMSTKRTSWNKFSSSMASAVIYLSSGKGFYEVDTPLFDGMLVERWVVKEGDVEVHGEEVNVGDAAEGDVSAAHAEVPTTDEEPSIPSPTPSTPLPQPSHDIPLSSQRRMIAEMDQDADVVLEDDKEVTDDVKYVQDDIDESAQDQGRKAKSQAEIYKIALEHANKVLSMQKDESEPTEVQEVVDVVTTAKINTIVVTAASQTITTTSITITAAEAQVLAFTLTVAPVRVTVAPSRRRKGVVIRDLQKESTTSTIILAKTKSKDKGKGILDEVIDHVKKKAKEDPAVKKYQDLKRKPQTEAQASKNIMLYLKNVAGFKMEYFKGMSYDDIRPIFEAKFNSNMAFLLKTKEKIEEEDSRALKRLNEAPAKKAAKRQKLDEEIEELKNIFR
nr:hypothetical protein [Tanacetum cinerariifolium]